MHPPAYTRDEFRLAALQSYAILDTPQDPAFDDIVALAAEICAAPVALVSFVAADRQWFKAAHGFQACETPLSQSICAFALVEPDLLIIADLTCDARTRDNTLVTGEPHIRFYAGAPLRAANGEVLGSLCVIDAVARPQGLTLAQADGLRRLARQVESQLALRRAVAERGGALAEAFTQETRRRESDAQYRGLFDAIDAGFCIIEVRFDGDRPLDYRFVEVNPAFERLTGLADAEGQWIRTLVPSLEPYWFELYGRVARTGEAARFEQRADGLGGRWYDVHAYRIGDAGERRVAILFTEVTDRKNAELARDAAEHLQRVLNEELSHRMKNTFAMVLAIAAQTLRPIADRERVTTFTGRIHVLASAHDILLQHGAETAQLDELVRQTVSLLAGAERCHISGPAIETGPRATLSIALILHELAANALKYGALSHEDGQVHVTWRLDGEGAAANLVMAWRETGGPPVAPPERHGFGSKLIRMGLLGAGGAAVRFVPAGLEADFSAPLQQVQMK